MTWEYILLIILILIGYTLYKMLKLQEDSSSLLSNNRDRMYSKEEMKQILEEKEKYKFLWEEQKELLKNKTQEVVELNSKNKILINAQETIGLELKKYDSFLNMVFYKILDLKEGDNNFEKVYANKSNIAMRATIMIMLDSLLRKNNLFINQLISVQKKLEKHKSYNESDILYELDKLGEEIVESLEKYEFDSENISEQLKEISTLFYGASSGYYSFIVPSIGSSFLKDKMEGQFVDIENGDIIKSVENWGIKVQNNIVYKARVQC